MTAKRDYKIRITHCWGRFKTFEYDMVIFKSELEQVRQEVKETLNVEYVYFEYEEIEPE